MEERFRKGFEALLVDGCEARRAGWKPCLHGLCFSLELLENFLRVWELLKPAVPEARERFANKQLLVNLEKAAQRYEAWSERRTPGHVAAMRQFMQQLRRQSASAKV